MAAKRKLRTLDRKALREIVEGTAAETGEAFFDKLVEHLARAIGTKCAWVTEWLESERRLRALSFWVGDGFFGDFEYDIADTPCEPVIENRCLVHVPERVLELYAHDESLEPLGAVSYMGVPLFDTDDRILGHLAVLHDAPMPEDEQIMGIFNIFAGRAAAELRRLRRDRDIREREEKLSRLVGSAMDAIVELDGDLRIVRMNGAAERVFGCDATEMGGSPFAGFLTRESRGKLTYLTSQLKEQPEGKRSLWIPDGIHATRSDGTDFPAEATLSHYEVGGRPYYALILRNINERLEAEERIRDLMSETEYLRAEIDALHGFDEIVGRSQALRRDRGQSPGERVLRTREGRLHRSHPAARRTLQAGRRRDDLPRRSWRDASRLAGQAVACASRGRVRAGGRLPDDPCRRAGHRRHQPRPGTDGEGGSFRTDLLYRLNVFPLLLPPLRERGGDVVLLAEEFARKFARLRGETPAPLTEACVAKLTGYDWPGNVRELQNVIERALITSPDGRRLNLERALPDAAPGGTTSEEGTRAAGPSPGDRVLTARELRDLERDNLLRALEAAGWKVSGAGGAAERLGMNPNTLGSRMKALGIRRP